MTVTAVRTRVDADEDGVLRARCLACDVELRQAPGADVAEALRAFDAHHPGTDTAPHSRRLPRGWRRL